MLVFVSCAVFAWLSLSLSRHRVQSDAAFGMHLIRSEHARVDSHLIGGIDPAHRTSGEKLSHPIYKRHQPVIWHILETRTTEQKQHGPETP